MSLRRSDDPLDTYLLRVFVLLITERSVSRTALRLNQSQPAVSAALKRLREILGDPLLVREKGGMVPTERALALMSHAKGALAEIDRMTDAPESFEPHSTRHEFRVGSPDYLAPVFVASVAERFRREAPQARLSLHALGPSFDFERSLAEGDLDVVIGNWPEPPHRMHLSMLLEDEIVCLVAASHPCAKKGMSVEDYMRAAHVVPMPYSISQRGVIDSVLASMRINRDERVAVQSFTAAPYLLQGTDLVFTTTRHFAQFYAQLLPLAIIPSPIAFPPMRFYQLWHERNHHSAGHRWLRRLLSDCGRRIVPPAAEGWGAGAGKPAPAGMAGPFPHAPGQCEDSAVDRHQHHRDVGLHRDLVRHRAEQQLADGAVAAGAHDDHVGEHVLGDVQDAARGVALERAYAGEHALDVELGVGLGEDVDAMAEQGLGLLVAGELDLVHLFFAEELLVGQAARWQGHGDGVQPGVELHRQAHGVAEHRGRARGQVGGVEDRADFVAHRGNSRLR